MAIIVDPPNSAGHGRLWSHVASDTSFEELHAFAAAFGIPERGFDRDHYDVPAEWYERLLQAGAVPVSSRALIERLNAAGLRRPKSSTLAPRRPGRPLLTPPRLRPGDLVAVVAPAGPAPPERLSAGVEVLESWGLRVRLLAESGGRRLPWLADTDAARAAAFADAWVDPDVRAVWATRGGYGVQRLLDLLDWDALAGAFPTLLVGFSDLTALHQALAARLGVAGVHGPGVAGLGDGSVEAREATRRLVMDAAPVVLHGEPSPGGGGIVQGPLVGGNLTMLATSVGTALVHPAREGIALLEEVGEQPYRLDRALTQLLRTGWFDQVKGVAVGSFTACGDAGLVRALLEDRLSRLGVPVVFGLPVGHGPGDLPVPLGVRARLDPVAGTLEVARAVR